jgi:2-aminomuconate deaminase
VSGTRSRRPDNSIAGVSVDATGTTTIDIASQTRAELASIRDILVTEDSSLADAVEITAFLVDMADCGGYNAVYGEFFGHAGPAPTTVAVHQLPHPHLRIGIKAIAFKPLAPPRCTRPELRAGRIAPYGTWWRSRPRPTGRPIGTAPERENHWLACRWSRTPSSR